MGTQKLWVLSVLGRDQWCRTSCAGGAPGKELRAGFDQLHSDPQAPEAPALLSHRQEFFPQSHLPSAKPFPPSQILPQLSWSPFSPAPLGEHPELAGTGTQRFLQDFCSAVHQMLLLNWDLLPAPSKPPPSTDPGGSPQFSCRDGAAALSEPGMSAKEAQKAFTAT